MRQQEVGRHRVKVALAHGDHALGMRRHDGADNFRAWFLVGFVHDAAADIGFLRFCRRDLEAVVGEVDVIGRVALPDGEDHVDGFGEQLVALLLRQAKSKSLGIGGQCARADAEYEAALGKMVEHRRVRRDQGGVGV